MNILVLYAVCYGYLLFGTQIAVALLSKYPIIAKTMLWLCVAAVIGFVLCIYVTFTGTAKTNEVTAPIHTAPNNVDYYFYDDVYRSTANIPEYQNGDTIVVEEYERSVYGIEKFSTPTKVRVIKKEK